MSQALKVTDWSTEQRMRMHDAFGKWLQLCSEDDYAKLLDLREQVAPGQVCSVILLVQKCFQRPDQLAGLPPSLVQLMRERSLLQPSNDASSP